MIQDIGEETTGLVAASPESDKKHRNPVWQRDELILALDLYMRFQGNPPGHSASEINELSSRATTYLLGVQHLFLSSITASRSGFALLMTLKLLPL